MSSPFAVLGKDVLQVLFSYLDNVADFYCITEVDKFFRDEMRRYGNEKLARLLGNDGWKHSIGLRQIHVSSVFLKGTVSRGDPDHRPLIVYLPNGARLEAQLDKRKLLEPFTFVDSSSKKHEAYGSTTRWSVGPGAQPQEDGPAIEYRGREGLRVEGTMKNGMFDGPTTSFHDNYIAKGNQVEDRWDGPHVKSYFNGDQAEGTMQMGQAIGTWTYRWSSGDLMTGELTSGEWADPIIQRAATTKPEDPLICQFRPIHNSARHITYFKCGRRVEGRVWKEAMPAPGIIRYPNGVEAVVTYKERGGIRSISLSFFGTRVEGAWPESVWEFLANGDSFEGSFYPLLGEQRIMFMIVKWQENAPPKDGSAKRKWFFNFETGQRTSDVWGWRRWRERGWIRKQTENT